MLLVKKIPDGKLVKVDIGIKGGKITKISIFGDFFLHPEESIDDIEKALIGVELKGVRYALDRIWTKCSIESTGISSESLADVILDGLKTTRDGEDI